MAERLWSQQAATQSVADLHRRLPAVSTQLETLGLRHRRAPQQLLHQLAGTTDVAPLRILTEVLEPVKEYKRHFQGYTYTTETRLNRLVDAAPAESEVARRFGVLVDSVLAAGAAPATRLPLLRALRTQALQWQANDARMQTLLLLNPTLLEYAPLSKQLAALAALVLERLEQLSRSQPPGPTWLATARATLTAAAAPAGQAELALVAPARRLVLGTK